MRAALPTPTSILVHMETNTLTPTEGITETVGADLTIGDVLQYLGNWHLITGFTGHRVCPVLGRCRVARTVTGASITVADGEHLTVSRP